MSTLWDQFKTRGLPGELVDKLKIAYTELKENFHLGKHKPAELEGGHFAEIVIRILQWATGGLPGTASLYTPLGQQLPRFDQEVKRLEGLPGIYSKSLRVHIPRVLLSMLDIRNGRGVGHPSGDVDPNLADATFVTAGADWVLAELMRLYHGVTLNQAQALVDGLVQRRVPVVQMFGDFPKILRADVTNPSRALIILYVRGEAGATSSDLGRWLKIEAKEARRIFRRLDSDAFVHFDETVDTGIITYAGIAEAERRAKLKLTVLL